MISVLKATIRYYVILNISPAVMQLLVVTAVLIFTTAFIHILKKIAVNVYSTLLAAWVASKIL